MNSFNRSRFASRLSLLAVVPLIGFAFGCSRGSLANGTQQTCKWIVSASRSANSADIPLVERQPLLRDPESPNRAAGPGRLLAVVKSDSMHHPQIYIEDGDTGQRRHLIRGSKPRWSPDGKMLACEVWKSVERPWMLCIVDVRTGATIEPDLGCLVDNFQWSPNGKSIAVGGTLPARSVNVLCWYQLAAGKSRMLDTLPVFASYEQFAWSPDSRELVVSRITAVDAEGQATAADLWIFDEQGNRCALTNSHELVEEEPSWITNHDILVTLRPTAGSPQATSERIVMSVSRATD